jgi:hypothetical protein
MDTIGYHRGAAVPWQIGGVTQVQFSGSEKLRTIENKSQVPHKIAINEEVKG